ncbi:hypothetical protein FXO37_17879 [Capsicum annuum]|nr:hypothetical protein FXO37_17879 [Capsicum annuum]
MLDFADEGNLVGKWGGHFGNWEGSVDLTSSLAEYEKDFEDLKINLVDSKVDFIYFVGLGVNLTDLGMHFLDLKMCFEDLGMYSKMDFVGLEMDFVDGRRLGYFHDWYFGRMEKQRWTIRYSADPRE